MMSIARNRQQRQHMGRLNQRVHVQRLVPRDAARRRRQPLTERGHEAQLFFTAQVDGCGILVFETPQNLIIILTTCKSRQWASLSYSLSLNRRLTIMRATETIALMCERKRCKHYRNTSLPTTQVSSLVPPSTHASVWPPATQPAYLA